MGMNGDTALALAKSYVKKTLQGQGALKGQDGFSPTITENADNTDKIYKLDITTADSSFTTPNLRGKDGEGSEGGEANVIESISVNGVNVSPDENKNVDIAVPDAYDDTAIKVEIAKKADTTSIPSKVSELTNDSNYQTADDVTATLAPYAKSADVSTEITTEIAKVVADAPEDLNTLKEMSDWIAGHENDASAMNSAISDNKTAITALQTGKADKSEIPTTVAELTDSTDYAKTTDIPTTLPADGGNSDTVNNHTVKSDVPENAVFTDTIYDDTDVQKIISDNGYGEVAGGKNLLNHNIIDSKIKNCSILFKDDTFYATNKGSYSYFVLSVQTIVGKSYTVTIKDWSDYSYRCIASVSDLSDNTLVSMVITDATLSMTFTAVSTESLIQINPNNTPNEMSNTIAFKCMLEEGSVATDYEPYFPSNKMLAEDVDSVKNDLGGLSFSVSDGTLSITDGTNTWTLPQTT